MKDGNVNDRKTKQYLYIIFGCSNPPRIPVYCLINKNPVYSWYKFIGHKDDPFSVEYS